MAGKIIQSPQFVELEGPLIYLAGPVRGTGNWQHDATAYIHQADDSVHIASPRASTYRGDHGVQNDWAVKYQEYAADDGCLLFWFPRETNHKCNRAYAHDARFELGEWAAYSWSQGVKIVVGIDWGFSGGSFLKERLIKDYPNIPICRTLKQTCLAAVELALGRSSKWSQIREYLT